MQLFHARPVDNTDAELDAFDEVCARLAGFNPRVSTEWADGYLTALAAGPRPVPLDEWLPRMADDAFERAFADPEDVGRARAALLARTRVLARQLDPETLFDAPDALRLRPLAMSWDDAAREQAVQEGWVAEGEKPLLLTGAVWAQGFLDAVHDFAADWDAAAADEPDTELFEQLIGEVVALTMDEDSVEFKAHLQGHDPASLPTRDDLLDEACFAIQDLRTWWVDHAPRPATRRVGPVPGRNDPCPCGSGLKYKKCHGKGA